MGKSGERKGGLGITAALAGLLFVMLRLLAVTHYEWDAAFALSDSINFDDTLGVLIGTFLGEPTWTAVLVAFLLPLLVGRHLRQIMNGQWYVGSTLAIVVLSGLFATALITYRLWVAVVVLAVGFAARAVVWFSGLGEGFLDRITARMGMLSVIAVLVMAGVTDSMWVPEERIELHQGELVGYVVSDTGAFVKVLTAQEREIRIVSDEQVLARTEVERR
ncbi:hypothetical protein GCM10027589_20360 [Actinocorallia lasiicapitis]